MHRIIQDLRVAVPCVRRPSYIPQARNATGSKAQGLAYEKKVGRWVRRQWPWLTSGQWFEFRDANGKGCCQVDHYLVLPDRVLALECKLTQTEIAESQIQRLYAPVLQAVYEKPVVGVQVCKHLACNDPRLITELNKAMASPMGDYFIWHCLL